MYRKPRFLEILHGVREEMSREADYDVELFAEMVRAGERPRRTRPRRTRMSAPETPAQAAPKLTPEGARPKRTA